MKTLYELAEQYKSDVKTRIKCLQNELPEQDLTCMNLCHEIEQQLDHWQATLEEINEVLAAGDTPDLLLKALKAVVKSAEDDEKLFCSDMITDALNAIRKVET